jgi:hypothetical protein
MATTPDAAIRQRIAGEILNFGTARIEMKDKMLKQDDFAFGVVTNKLPSLVGEASQSEPRTCGRCELGIVHILRRRRQQRRRHLLETHILVRVGPHPPQGNIQRGVRKRVGQ